MSSRSLQLPCKRTATLCLCAALTFMFLAGAHPPAAMSAAVGGGNALSELTQGGQASTATQTTATTTTTESNSNSSKVVVLALVAAVALLIGIAFVIVRDARRVAPVADGQLAEGGPARDVGAKMRRRRAQAKAARRQRKRNR